MSRSRLVVLAMIVVSSSPAWGGDYPYFKVGESDLVFTEAAEESSSAELKRRFHAAKDAPAYDIAKEKFRAIVPATYRHDDAAWGLFVWVDSGPQPGLPGGWGAVLAEKRLICVAALESGNQRDLFDRCRMAVDAAHNMRKRFHIDPDRVYVSGMSGGGRVSSMLGVAYADVFAGTFPFMGTNFYKPIPTGEPNKVWLPMYEPDPRILASAKTRNRYVLMTGETDFNRENTQRIVKDGFKAEGFRHTLYIEVPGVGHQRPPAEWLAKGIKYLDDEAPPRDGGSSTPPTSPGTGSKPQRKPADRPAR
jgi:dienelactone hydrolase